MRIENTFGNDSLSLRNHFNMIVSRFGRVSKLGMDRFTNIRRATNPTIDELETLCLLLHKNFARFHNIIFALMQLFVSIIESLSVAVIDESVIGYQPRLEVKQKAELNGEPIPVTYIPRKPHPNGLLIYLACTFISHPTKLNSKLPYIIDIWSHLKVGDIGPQTAFMAILDRWQNNKNVHFVADSAFGGWEMLEAIKSWGGKGTLAMNNINSPWLWEILKKNVPPNCSRIANSTKNSFLAFNHTIIDKIDNKFVHQHIITNAFTSTPITINVQNQNASNSKLYN